MTGNVADATLAQLAYDEGDNTFLFSMEGSTRIVYLINNVIYKVECEPGYNEREYLNITINRAAMPTGVFYPDVNLFTVNGVSDVIAMNLIEGQGMAECFCTQNEECEESCMPESIKSLLNGILDDTGGMNVIVNDAGVWIIDAA